MRVTEVLAAHSTVGVDWQILPSNNRDPFPEQRLVREGKAMKGELFVTICETTTSGNHTSVSHDGYVQQRMFCSHRYSSVTNILIVPLDCDSYTTIITAISALACIYV